MTSRAIYEVECGPEIHEIEIRDGKPHMLNHDEEMIEAFTAFGAEVPECLLWVKRWKWKWHEEAALHGLAPPLARYAELILYATRHHVLRIDIETIKTRVGDGTVSSVPGGWMLYALPGPPEYMDDERRDYCEQVGLSEHAFNLLKYAGDRGFTYVLLAYDDEAGWTIPDLPRFVG
jgi:hypothetical protein